MIYYSIIIPHKNIPDLLQRCLDSIPVRDDVQVIVVDDNSDPTIVDFDNFPGVGRPNTEVYFTKEGKGAGYARNIGLDHATGKWLLFLDSDDFLSSDACVIFDNSINSPFDLVFYDNMTVMSDDVSKKSSRDSIYHSFIQNYLHGNYDETNLRYGFQPLWGKLIRHSIVIDNNIRFDEVGWSNDVYFSCRVGYHAKTICVFDDILYVVTQRAGSLTSNFCGTGKEFNARLKEAVKSESFLAARNIHPNKLQSDSIIKRYYIEHGKKKYIHQLISQKCFSKEQLIMGKFLFLAIKERYFRKIH